MQQGSEVSLNTPHSITQLPGAVAIQRARVVAVKEVSSLLSTMQHMALYCIDQNHVTLDHMETMSDTLGVLQRQVNALYLELANN
jgi:hypothetical protein